jgi:SAM-dependent methyltransferase
VLDLGCGNGIPTARDLAARFQLTGVDISPRQIDAAKAAVPSGTFVVGDMTSVTLPAASFDAVVAFYSIIHVRISEWPDLLDRIHDWLRPHGRLLVTLGTVEGEALEEDWLGVPMFFAGRAPFVDGHRRRGDSRSIGVSRMHPVDRDLRGAPVGDRGLPGPPELW